MDPFSGPFYGPKFGPPAKSRKRIKTESVVPIFGTRSFTAARLPQPRLYQPTGGEQTLVNQFLVQKWTCFWVPARRYLSMLYLACCCTKRTYREYNDSNKGTQGQIIVVRGQHGFIMVFVSLVLTNASQRCIFLLWRLFLLFSQIYFSSMTPVSIIFTDAFFYRDACFYYYQRCNFLSWRLFLLFSEMHFSIMTPVSIIFTNAFSIMTPVCIILRDAFSYHDAGLYTFRRRAVLSWPWSCSRRCIVPYLRCYRQGMLEWLRVAPSGRSHLQRVAPYESSKQFLGSALKLTLH